MGQLATSTMEVLGQERALHMGLLDCITLAVEVDLPSLQRMLLKTSRCGSQKGTANWDGVMRRPQRLLRRHCGVPASSIRRVTWQARYWRAWKFAFIANDGWC